MINIDPNKIRRDEKSHRKILICHIGYVMVKHLSYTAINSVNNSYFIINNINGYIEKESNGNQNLTLVPTN